jgi:NTE family protein
MITRRKKTGLALGGGGVRGIAHVPALEVIDAYGIKPCMIAGTSMGAIIGALYASGKSGRDIRDLIEQHMVNRTDKVKNVYAKKDFLLAWLDAVRVSGKGSGIFRVDGFLRHLIEQMEAIRFEDLKIPLRVVATDFYSGEPYIFDSGPLLPALKATISIPGVFEPVQHDGRILFDGGVCNNLPYDILQDKCNRTIAINVAPTRVKGETSLPGMLDATVGMFDVLMERATRAKLEKSPPDIYFHPRLVGIRMLEFHKARDVFMQTAENLPELQTLLQRFTYNDT